MHPEYTYIYGLIDPETKELRYVGKANDVEKRLKGHLREKYQSHKRNWIDSLLHKGLTPQAIILARVRYDAWREAERRWIKLVTGLGFKLVNGTNGGDGCDLTQELREKLRTKVRSPAHRRKLSASLKKTYADLSKREAISERQKALFSDREYKAHRTKIFMASVMSSEAIEKRCKYNKAVRNGDIPAPARKLSPAGRKSKSAFMKSRWKDPSYIAEQKEKLSSKLARKKNSERVKTLWADPEYRSKQAEIRKSAGYKHKKSEGLKRNWEERKIYQGLKEKTRMQDVVLELAKTGG